MILKHYDQHLINVVSNINIINSLTVRINMISIISKICFKTRKIVKLYPPKYLSSLNPALKVWSHEGGGSILRRKTANIPESFGPNVLSPELYYQIFSFPHCGMVSLNQGIQ